MRDVVLFQKVNWKYPMLLNNHTQSEHILHKAMWSGILDQWDLIVGFSLYATQHNMTEITK